MGCRDKSIDYLKSYGYNVVRLPRADLQPLELLSRGGGGGLDRFGSLTTVLVGDGSVPVPEIKSGEPTAAIASKKSSSLKVGLGLSVLGNIVAAMGGSKVGLDVTYANAATVEFEFSDVVETRVEVAALDRYLGSADVDPLSVHAANLLEDDEIYVITSTIKSPLITVHAKSSDDVAVKLEVPVVQEVVGGDVEVSVAASDDDAISFKGKASLVFGFQAVQLFYEDGIYRALAQADDTHIRALSEAPADGAVRYVATAPFVRLGS